ncbi:MAG: ATP-binding cassette domain-containing protein [Candidatus Uhrbacteria bacterium]
MSTIIKVNNLSKSFHYHKKDEGLTGSLKALFRRERLVKEAVKKISFEIEQGEFVGFIGPNGAGKTTTLKMLSGILYPTEGVIRVAGHIPSEREEAFKKKISIVMGQKMMIWPTLPPIETYNLIQRMYDLNETTYRNKIKELSELMEVQDILNVQARKLSLGQRMKCELIASLLHNPKVIFLDEPTIGLDIIAQKNIRDFFKIHNKQNKTTVILTSHNMDDVKDLCQRLIIIDKGQVGYDGSIDSIISEYSKNKIIKVVFEDRVKKQDIQGLGVVTKYSLYEMELSVPVEETKKTISKLISKYPVKDLNISDVTLEEVVSDIFQKNNDQKNQ